MRAKPEKALREAARRKGFPPRLRAEEPGLTSVTSHSSTAPPKVIEGNGRA